MSCMRGDDGSDFVDFYRKAYNNEKRGDDGSDFVDFYRKAYTNEKRGDDGSDRLWVFLPQTML